MRHLDGLLASVDDNRWGHMDGWGGGWMWLWGVAMMVLFAVLVVWLIRAVMGAPGAARDAGRPGDRAREILAERYARGELTTEEYRERLDHLQ